MPGTDVSKSEAGKTEYSDSDYFVMNANMKLRLASSGASDDVLNSASAASATNRKATDFRDFDRTAWYAEAVSAAVDNGLLYGKSATTNVG